MIARVKAIVLKGQVAHRHEANNLLTEPGATVIVYRGVARSVAMTCPDGCGDQLTVNLDKRAGPAWRHYHQDQRLTIYPSVWRETGCRSHFIVLRSKIYWCDLFEQLETPNEETLKIVHQALSDRLVNYVAIADALQLIPWEVLSACGWLADKGLAEAGHGNQRAHFRRKQK